MGPNVILNEFYSFTASVKAKELLELLVVSPGVGITGEVLILETGNQIWFSV